LITNDNLDIHASGHASQEEQKIMLNLIRPKNFIPIHGELFMRVAHKNTAMELGHKDENIFLSDNGNILDIAPDGKIFRSKIQVPLQEIIVDGNGIGTAGSHVIKAREKMMNS
jgi:ribonuclease J